MTQRDSLDLNGLWMFQPDPAGEGEHLGYGRLEYEDAHWREVSLPADFATCHPALDSYEGAGWFRRRVVVPESWRGKRVCVCFEGVNYHAKVWWNGALVGEHHDGFLPFSFPVHDGIQFGEENVVVVRADNVRRADDVPGLQRGWRTFGGILREVSLVATEHIYLEHIATVAEPAPDGGRLRVEVTLGNLPPSSSDAVLHTYVMDAEGETLAWFVSPLTAFDVDPEPFLVFDDVIAGVELWSPASPALYTVKLEARVNNQPVDVQTVKVGFRRVTVREGQLYLNGAPLYLTGFNRHEDSPRTNMCPDLELVRWDLEAMQEAGANFVRLCHYPHHPGELDLCDELGMLVMAEIPLYWWEGFKEGQRECARKLGVAERQLRAMIQRDINHPSIIAWSVSNETDEARPEVADGNRVLLAAARELDPTRLVTHVSDRWRTHPNFEDDDVVCVNAYPTVMRALSQPDPEYDLEHSIAFWREELATLHARYPEKPILVTEFGHVSLGRVRAGVLGEDTQADVLAREFEGLDAPYVCGATVWCWADHPWPPATFEFCNYLALSPFGVVGRDRRKRQAYERIKQLFRQTQGLSDPSPDTVPVWSDAGYVVSMLRPNLDDIPQIPFPEGFGIRPMRLDEAGLWTDIQRDAEPYFQVRVDTFAREFGYDPQAIPRRCYIVTNERGLGIGVISAWYDQEFKGGVWGRVHWVALRRAYWGRGLGKAMLSYTLTQMAQWHDRACLGTQTRRLPAIKLYLDFGFVPDLDPPGAVEAWRTVKAELKHPVLDDVVL